MVRNAYCRLRITWRNCFTRSSSGHVSRGATLAMQWRISSGNRRRSLLVAVSSMSEGYIPGFLARLNRGFVKLGLALQACLLLLAFVNNEAPCRTQREGHQNQHNKRCLSVPELVRKESRQKCTTQRDPRQH